MRDSLVLASDMDGTFIPLNDCPDNRRDLARLSDLIERHRIELLYVTGRDLHLVQEAIQTHQLPRPRWIIGDVGTSIYQCDGQAAYRAIDAYRQHLHELIQRAPIHRLRDRLSHIAELRLQESEKQGEFKLSYYCDAEVLQTVVVKLEGILHTERLPYSVISSLDPFSGTGLLDFLPHHVSKGYALAWWVRFVGHVREDIIFAGDSGNDQAAFMAGYRSILVSNADEAVVAETVSHHERNAWADRLYLADASATSGVLEGLMHFAELADFPE